MKKHFLLLILSLLFLPIAQGKVKLPAMMGDHMVLQQNSSVKLWAMTAAIRKVFAEKPAEFDPRKYLGPARDNMEKLYKHKILNVLGSDNKLAQ